MHYHIYCNTKNMNKNHLLAIQEFQKRLSAYCDTTLHTGLSLDIPTESQVKNHHFIFLQEGISSDSSEDFSRRIHVLQHTGTSTVHVIIGYNEKTFFTALPTSEVFQNINYISFTCLSLSNETQTLLFYEQLYRGYTILQGKTYHK